jgi:pyruvate dehydrogenase E2 component (dihydrolipoamide acetyltransferase)
MPEGVRASPLAKRVAREQGIDLSALRGGSGPSGRIVRADVDAYQKALADSPAAPSPALTPRAPVAAGAGDTAVETPKMRRRIAARMIESKTTVPHFYVTANIDMGPALDLRKDLNKRLEGQGVKITVNDLIVKAVALALRDYPNINSSFNGDTVIRHGRINVGIAVSVENGLLNVVSQDADQTPLTVMAKTHAELIDRARSGKVKPEDVEGETIAVSNLGAYEVDSFTAIINPPAAAILAVGSAAQVPVVVDGALAVGWRMKATLSADHRVTDGAEAAQMLQKVKQILEDPLRLLM